MTKRARLMLALLSALSVAGAFCVWGWELYPDAVGMSFLLVGVAALLLSGMRSGHEIEVVDGIALDGCRCERCRQRRRLWS